MATIETDYAGLKRLAKQFIGALPGATDEEAEAGWHCFALAYLGAQTNGPVEDAQAASLYQVLARLYMRGQAHPAAERPRLLQQWLGVNAPTDNLHKGA